ncbi:hypothetical protein L210DRAFT_3630309 [Boletus edulis BED1]|uniref:Uncharacterized protein n=1 Tax=Boletus edulis BED1 TaxID=1328754 RepID=A0AAD4BWC2_BOLED|nr:hypothetical protein L210DRAFT_3630309 [Boletus edulis BED1]
MSGQDRKRPGGRGRRAVVLEWTPGDEHSGSRGHGGSGTRAVALKMIHWLGGRRAVALERTWMGGDERSGSRGHSGGGRQAAGIKKGLVEVGGERLRSNGHGWAGDERPGSKKAWWTRGWVGMSDQARKDSGGGRRAVTLESIRLGGRRAAAIEKGLVEVGDVQLGSKKAWWTWETSGCARMDTVGREMSIRAREDMVEVGHEQLRSN